MLFIPNRSITTVCFRGEKDAIVCLKALAAEVHNQRGFVDSNSRTSLLICNKQEREDGAPSWIFWEEDKAIQNTVPRIAVYERANHGVRALVSSACAALMRLCMCVSISKRVLFDA